MREIIRALQNHPKPLSENESWCPSLLKIRRFQSHANVKRLCIGPRFDRDAQGKSEMSYLKSWVNDQNSHFKHIPQSVD